MIRVESYKLRDDLTMEWLINDEDLLYVFITNLGANKVGPLMNKVLYSDCTEATLQLLYSLLCHYS